jgi:hypothetical protein
LTKVDVLLLEIVMAIEKDTNSDPEEDSYKKKHLQYLREQVSGIPLRDRQEEDQITSEEYDRAIKIYLRRHRKDFEQMG